MSDLDIITEKFGDKVTDLENNTVRKSDLDSTVAELRKLIADNNDGGRDKAEEFIEHMSNCSDESCSIHMMSDSLKKKGFLTGFASGHEIATRKHSNNKVGSMK
jgi:Fe-S-cluster formation regulator IscX/YfhJ